MTTLLAAKLAADPAAQINLNALATVAVDSFIALGRPVRHQATTAPARLLASPAAVRHYERCTRARPVVGALQTSSSRPSRSITSATRPRLKPALPKGQPCTPVARSQGAGVYHFCHGKSRLPLVAQPGIRVFCRPRIHERTQVRTPSASRFSGFLFSGLSREQRTHLYSRNLLRRLRRLPPRPPRVVRSRFR